MDNDEQAFIDSSRQLTMFLLARCAKLGLDRDDTANLLCASTGEALAQTLGGVQAVERLRDVADLLERSILQTAKH